MVYLDKFIAVVKCNGKIMREISKDTIQLPFGSEYSLLFKNLSSQRAGVSISIDGEDVLNGRKLIIDSKDNLELERFIKNDMNQGNKFKFIQKTDKIVDHRGDRIDDGIIRIEFAFEENYRVPTLSYTYDYLIPTLSYTYNYPIQYGYNYPIQFQYGSGSARGTYNDVTVMCACAGVAESTVCSDSLAQDEGITVPGSISNQSFHSGSLGNLGKSQVIIFKLQGIDSNNVTVSQPITVKTKLECETCGTRNSSKHKFCTECGTSLL